MRMMYSRPFRGRLAAGCLLALIAGLSLAAPVLAQSYQQTNLVSDIPGLAHFTDKNLANPWGISFSSASPFWISDNRTGVATLYNGAGQPFPVATPLVVTIPPPAGGNSPSAPTGQVFNATSSFELAPGQLARFIFATEDGTISGWNPSVNATNAILKVDNSATEAIYKGLAIGNNGTSDFLYAANFHGGTIDVFDKSFAPATLAGSFTDPGIPAGFAPFNIQNLGGKLYVTYAKQDADGEDDVAGAGNGYVSVFDLNGNLERRLVSAGLLNSPWGLALAPNNFGLFSNSLLIGNFGDGIINAFNPLTGQSLGHLMDSGGNPISNEGLWGLTFGNGGNGGKTDVLYFTAGISGGGEEEEHGLFGSIQAVPEPASLAVLSAGLIGLALRRPKRRR